jgi:hypothetical protein
MRPFEMPIYLHSHLHLHLHNSYFTNSLFELSQTEYEIGQFHFISFHLFIQIP